MQTLIELKTAAEDDGTVVFDTWKSTVEEMITDGAEEFDSKITYEIASEVDSMLDEIEKIFNESVSEGIADWETVFGAEI